MARDKGRRTCPYYNCSGAVFPLTTRQYGKDDASMQYRRREWLFASEIELFSFDEGNVSRDVIDLLRCVCR